MMKVYKTSEEKRVAVAEHYRNNREAKLAYAREYREKHTSKLREYREKHRVKMLAVHKAYYHANREKAAERNRLFHEANPDYKKVSFKKWYDANRDKERKRKLEYGRKRRLSDPLFRLQENLRARIHQALKSRKPPSSRTMKSIGCTVEFLKGWMESRWQPGMSWGNYGNHGWHVDHVIPCSVFDLSNPEEALQCFHYTNLQPLWAKDNLRKGNKFAGDGAQPKNTTSEDEVNVRRPQNRHSKAPHKHERNLTI